MTQAEIDRICGKAAEAMPGEFHLPDLWGPDWERLPIGEKVAKGNHFLRLVRSGDVPRVEDTGRKSGGGRIYRKRGGPR